MYTIPLTARLIPILLASSILAACGGNSETPSDTAVSPEAPAPTTATAGPEINEPLNPEKVKVTLSLVGQPVYVEGEDVLQFNIRVANTGQVDLVGAGTKPVNLAALLLGPDGPDKEPGMRDFVRVPLPLVAQGAQQILQANLPAEKLQGQTVEFQLVQEGVAWFDGFGQAPLDLGAYSRCSKEEKTLCDKAGTPVTKQ